MHPVESEQVRYNSTLEVSALVDQRWAVVVGIMEIITAFATNMRWRNQKHSRTVTMQITLRA